MTKLQKAWVERLVADYQSILYSRNIQLDEPNFTIIAGSRKMGHWDARGKVIALSSYLIENHTWDVVIEILKHEMAHQYVYEHGKSAAGAPHGPAFQEACEYLGVHPDYRRATGEIPKFIRRDDTGEEGPKRDILRKVEKLLALAGSANENEASLAMERANSLIAKYNIEMVTETNSQSYDYVQVGHGQKRIPIWTKVIGTILRDFFFVRIITTEQYDARTDSTYKVLELMGRSENLAVAEHVFYFLHERLALLWQQHRRRTGASGREKRSYFLGVLNGFIEKMTQADRQTNTDILKDTTFSTTGALVLAKDMGLIHYFRNRYPHVTTRRTKASNIYTDAYNSGKEEGEKLTIHKSVSQSTGNQGQLLS